MSTFSNENLKAVQSLSLWFKILGSALLLGVAVIVAF